VHPSGKMQGRSLEKRCIKLFILIIADKMHLAGCLQYNKLLESVLSVHSYTLSFVTFGSEELLESTKFQSASKPIGMTIKSTSLHFHQNSSSKSSKLVPSDVPVYIANHFEERTVTASRRVKKNPCLTLLFRRTMKDARVV